MNLQPYISTPPNAHPATLFGFRVSEKAAAFFLAEPTSQNNWNGSSTHNHQPSQQVTFSEFSQITPVTSISEGTTAMLPGAVRGPKPGKKLVARIESYLSAQERKAKTVDRREAYQLAQSVVSRAYDGCDDPYTLAFCWFYGGNPELIQWKQEYYRAWMLRETLPAKPALRVASSTNQPSPALPPKKPVVSVRPLQEVRRGKA